MTPKDLPPNLRRLVFVYGTLKKGFCRNYYLADSVFIGETRTCPIYRLYDCGDYPGMVLAETVQQGQPQGNHIDGEVWAVDEATIEQLDVVEAVEEGLYRRTFVELVDSFPIPVEGYLYCQSVLRLVDCGKSWTRGFSP